MDDTLHTSNNSFNFIYKRRTTDFFYMATKLSIVYTSLLATSRITVLFIRNPMNPAKGNTSLLLLSLPLVCLICISLDSITLNQPLRDGDGQLLLSTSMSFHILKSVHNSLIINVTNYISFNVHNQVIIHPRNVEQIMKQNLILLKKKFWRCSQIFFEGYTNKKF